MHLKYGHWWAIKVLIIFKLLKRISFDQKERTKWQEGFDCLFGLNLLTLRGPYSRPSLFIQLGVLPINIAINYLLQLLCFLHFLGRKNVFTCSLACLLACLLTQQVVRCNKYTSQTFFFLFSFFVQFHPFPLPPQITAKSPSSHSDGKMSCWCFEFRQSETTRIQCDQILD